MRIAHLVSSDIGGAARAAIRINDSINLIDNSYENNVIVVKKSSSNNFVKSIATSKLKKINVIKNNFINNTTIKRYKNTALFSNELIGFNLLKENDITQCDLINLHWINGGMLSYRSLKSLQKLNKPITWTLHDMWPFTGGCHYDEECGKYKTECGNCKVLGSQKGKDLSTKIQRKKEKIYSQLDMTIVGCSSWITECAKESKLFKDKKFTNIPNCIDIETFKPINKETAKSILNIKTHKKIVLFGAMSSTSDKRKGFQYLLESVKSLDKEKYVAVIFGNTSKESEIEEYIETIYMGQLVDDYTLAL